MRLRLTQTEPRASLRRLSQLVIAAALSLAALGPTVVPASAAGELTMEARILLNGNARIGSWMAIEVHLVNNGPAVTGELRLAGGSQGQTRFGRAVDLPTQSDKTEVLYAQPPAFGSELEIVLASGEEKIASTKAKFSIHDTTQLVVAVVAERPEDIIGGLRLPPNQNQIAPLLMGIRPEDLPERVEGWNMLDRLIWHDVAADRLSPGQLTSLRGWVANGGRLIITGGTGGPRTLAAFPDALLPYRPTATTDIPASALAGLLGEIPDSAVSLPALTGELTEGRALATFGDRVAAAEHSYGTGQVTLLGFDPGWIVDPDTADGLWRRLLPPRTFGGLIFSDDNMLVSAVSQLPSLALPPIGALIVLLGAYILLIGPINYLVLRRLDRREWAWLTMPVLVLAFTFGAYGIGSALRGNDVIVNEVAIVAGAPGATEGSGQVYVGIFSPSRGRYQVSVPGGALLSSPINDFFGNQGAATQLDVLQGDPARVRNLAVGFGSLRTIRAETPVAVPLIQTDLRLEDGRLRGTVKNLSDQKLDRPAVVLGGTVARLRDLEPGAEAQVNVEVQNVLFGQSLSDKVVGQIFFGNGAPTADMAALYIRHSMVDQLTYDPMFGSTGQLSNEGPVVLAWGSQDLLHIEIEGQEPRRLGNVLYYLPTRMAISGATTFRSDLIRSTVVNSDAAFFSKDPYSINFGRGTATIAYRPTTFEGTLEATELALGLNFGGDTGLTVKPTEVEPLPEIPPRCPNPPTAECAPAILDGLPDVELFDATNQEWKRLPHLNQGARYAVKDPANYVDPATGTVLVRYVNDRMDGVGFSVDLSITGKRSMTAIVQTHGLVKRYDKTLAVAGLDLAVDPGEIFGLVGPNGAGKTTTLRMLATLLRPSAGSAEIDGWSVTRNPDEVRRVLGFMPDVFGVYDDMKVWEYLDFFARCYGLPAAGRRRMIADLLELVDLGDRRDDYVQTLSRGMEQRLCLAHALVHDPKVLLLDEPASGLDPRARVELRELLRELRVLGKTILISSHILPELEELCTSVAIVDHGQVLAQGRVADIERRLRFGAVIRVRLLLDGEALEAARDKFAADEDVASASILEDGTIELGFRGDDEASARLLAVSVAAGLPIVSFARAASDLEELFLQVTAPNRQPLEAA